ncbi:MAG: permease-like cell division protein FtsX [bacterium]
MLSNLEFFLVEALRSLRRGALMSFVAVGTITVSLVIFGLFLLSVINLGNVVGDVSSKMDVAAYVEEDISLEQAGALQIKLSNLPGVEKVVFVSKDEAWREFKKEFGQKLQLDEIISTNPLPHTFNIRVRAPELLSQVAATISEMKVVDDIRYSGEFVDQIKALVDAVRVGGAALVILISFATLLIVVNTIRLTVLARETDISIMKLVGATDTFVKWPFIIEGVILGVVGGFFAFLIMRISYAAMVSRVARALPFVPIVTDGRVLFFIYLALVLGGTAVGTLGAYISVSRVLKAEV